LGENGREDEAREVLISAHGGTADLDEEIATIREVIRLDTDQKARLRDLLAPWVRPMLLVALLLAMGSSSAGFNAVNAYFRRC